MEDKNVQPQSNERPKRGYQKPQVTEYGDIRKITQSIGTIGNTDGAPGGGPANLNKTKLA
jgi:hypothetical protein